MAGKFAWKSQDARSCMQGTYKICSPFWCCVHHSSNRCPKVGCKKPGMLTLHAWEPLIEDQQPDLSFALLTSLQRGLGYQEQEVCDTGVGQPATTPVSHLDLSWLWMYSLCTLLPLYFDLKLGALQTLGLEKLKLQGSLSFVTRYPPACICGLADVEIWGGVSVSCSSHGQGRKRGERNKEESGAVPVLYWILFGVLIEAWAWWVCS